MPNIKQKTTSCLHLVSTVTFLSEGGSEIGMENPPEFADTTRREVVRKAVFIAPVILTLPVIPSFAKAGSNGTEDPDEHGEQDGTNISGGSQSQRRRRRHHWWPFSG